MSENGSNENNTVTQSELLKIRRDKLQALRDLGKDPYNITKFEKTHSSSAILSDFDAMEGSKVNIAGRLMSKRVMGKASFSHVQDMDGQIQLYVRRDVLGEEPYAEYKKFDIGDIVGITGEVFKTNKGEISV